MQMYYTAPENLFPTPRTEFEMIRDLKLKVLYYKQLSLKYEEECDKQLSTRKINSWYNVTQEKLELPFVKCVDVKHIYVKDKILYRCVNCGEENKLESCNILLPTDIIVSILRMDKSLFHLSRTVSKTIRNASLNDILQHEILLPIIKDELSILIEPFAIIENESFNDVDNGGYYGNTDIFVISFNKNKSYPVYYYKGSYLHPHDGGEKTCSSEFGEITMQDRMKSTGKSKQDADFVSFYKIMVQRLNHYECNKQSIALSLTLDKFNKMSINKFRMEFMLFLVGTATV